MHICLTSLYHQPMSPHAWIQHDTIRHGLASHLAVRGHRVSVVQAFHQDDEVFNRGVTWYFVKSHPLTRMVSAALWALGDPWPGLRTPTPAITQKVASLQPDILHSFDLTAYPSLYALGRYATREKIPVFAHYHGGRPATRPWMRAWEQLATRHLSAAFFTTPDRSFGACPTRLLPETSTELTPHSQTEAQHQLHMTGTPLILSPGRLEPGKDPTTILRGFARFSRQNPQARLYLCYTDAPQLNEIKSLAHTLNIQDQTVFMGTIPPALMALTLSAADVVVQASRREVFGRAPLEALACGVPVVLADIPPARLLTNHGQEGRLFACGDDRGLAQQLAHPGLYTPQARTRARAWFEERFSFTRLAQDLETIYRCSQIPL